MPIVDIDFSVERVSLPLDFFTLLQKEKLVRMFMKEMPSLEKTGLSWNGIIYNYTFIL